MYRRRPQGWIKHIDFFLLDVMAFVLAFAASCFIRHGVGIFLIVRNYSSLFLLYLLTIVLLHIVNNTFSGVLKRGCYKELAHTVRHVVFTELAAIAFLFATQQSDNMSRIIVGLTALLYIVISYCFRLLWKRVLRKYGNLMPPVSLYIITTEDRAADVVNDVRTGTKGEYQIQGLCLLDIDRIGEAVADIPISAAADTVLDYLCDKWVDEVYIALPEQSPIPNYLIDKLTEMGVAVHLELDPAGSESWQIRQVQYIGGKLVQTISMTNMATRDLLAKRIMDIVGGVVGCLITAILTVVLGPLIYIQSPGPIFFSQIRVGKNGKLFKMYKFRSMYPDAEDRKAELMKENRIRNGMMFKLEADPRIIGCRILPDGTVKKGLGNFMREYSLDEFPQFYNVLKGDLSLVGTRPPTVDEWEKYHYHHRARLAAKPGITGMWQISGRSKITDFEEIVALDKKYIREWTMGMDLRILLKTIIVVLRKDGSM